MHTTVTGMMMGKKRGYYGDGGGLYLRVAPGGTSWILKAKPDPAAVMAHLRVLESKLSNAFEAEADYPNAMQDRYVVAQTAFANFLMGAGIDEKIAHKFIELASGMKQGSLPFLHPPEASGRTYDSEVIWNYRGYVVIGLECILRSGKMKLRPAAKYIAKEYPVFDRLKRNPSDSLATSIISWRRYFDEGKGYEYLRANMDMFYQPCDSAEMFERAKRALRIAAEDTARDAL